MTDIPGGNEIDGAGEAGIREAGRQGWGMGREENGERGIPTLRIVTN